MCSFKNILNVMLLRTQQIIKHNRDFSKDGKFLKIREMFFSDINKSFKPFKRLRKSLQNMVNDTDTSFVCCQVIFR